jgi:hypothetical protein
VAYLYFSQAKLQVCPIITLLANLETKFDFPKRCLRQKFVQAAILIFEDFSKSQQFSENRLLMSPRTLSAAIVIFKNAKFSQNTTILALSHTIRRISAQQTD